jgi:hypothetical protein
LSIVRESIPFIAVPLILALVFVFFALWYAFGFFVLLALS